jgi:hypothetical protein
MCVLPGTECGCGCECQVVSSLILHNVVSTCRSTRMLTPTYTPTHTSALGRAPLELTDMLPNTRIALSQPQQHPLQGVPTAHSLYPCSPPPPGPSLLSRPPQIRPHLLPADMATWRTRAHTACPAAGVPLHVLWCTHAISLPIGGTVSCVGGVYFCTPNSHKPPPPKPRSPFLPLPPADRAT